MSDFYYKAGWKQIEYRNTLLRIFLKFLCYSCELISVEEIKQTTVAEMAQNIPLRLIDWFIGLETMFIIYEKVYHLFITLAALYVSI